jgi:hypothetical protein
VIGLVDKLTAAEVLRAADLAASCLRGALPVVRRTNEIPSEM